MSLISSNGKENGYQLTRIGCPATISGVADVFKLSQDVTLIGRAKEKVQFFLDSLKHKGLISRIHATIFKSKSQTGQDVFKICDTSLNGTFVNDVKILNEALLKPGDSVSFGHLQGAVLQAGNRYSQPNSEFRFKFEMSSEAERFGYKHNGLNDCEYEKNSEPGLATDRPPQVHKTRTASDFPNLSIPLETPTPLIVGSSADRGSMSLPTCTTKRKLAKTFNASDEESETDFKIFQEYASAACVAAGMQSDSDEDLFSIKYTSVLPGGVMEILEKEERCNDQVLERKRQKRRVKTENTRVNSVKTENTSQLSKRTSSDCLDSCSAMKCLKPNEKLVSWVQCDDCDQWYHVKCAGLSLKLVKPKNAKFHCGCT